MENIADKILLAREQKDNLIKSYVDVYQVVSLKANIPGSNKNIKEAFLLLNIFFKKIIKFNPIKTMFFNSMDGPYYLFLFDKNISLKEKMVCIENENELSRLIDIDVYLDKYHSLNRSRPRKCFICNESALICSRMQKHGVSELINHISKICENHLRKTIKEMIDESMLVELNLHPKFGLVTPYSNGSHLDMDYKIMMKAKDAIVDDLTEMFMLGYQEDLPLDLLFYKARDIGKKADFDMFNATNGINAYQGLIFNLGLVLVNFGKVLKDNLSLKDAFINIKKMSKEFIKEGNYGARKQASLGYEIIINLFKNHDISKMSTMDKLIYFIINLDDTILLKRCKNEKLIKTIKEEFKKIDSSNKLLINQMDEMCIKNNLSFGGCADLLVVTIFIEKFSETFNKIYS